MGLPAARVGDATAHGSPLGPGPGCPTVLIGGMPAWRGASPAAAAALGSAVAALAGEIAAKSAVATAAAGTPAGPAAQAELARTAVQGVANLSSMMAGMGDNHACPIVKVVIPDGMGVVTACSTTVMIGGMGAARMGDPITECTSASTVAAGCPTVLIG